MAKKAPDFGLEGSQQIWQSPPIPTPDPKGSGGFAQGAVDNVASNVQNLLSLTPHGKYTSGARTIVRINGKIAAFATSISWHIQTVQDEINQIDDWTPFEYAPKLLTVEGTIGGFHLPGKGPVSDYIVPNTMSFMFHKYIQLEVRDRSTDALLFMSNRVVVTGLSERIQANETGTINLTWKAIGFMDETGSAAMAPDGVPGLSGNKPPAKAEKGKSAAPVSVPKIPGI